MNLVVIAALVAVCGAAKLDRTYLPPASAKTAGGIPGSLQTPFTTNSFNYDLGGIPKGSYENDFQGVVVDAAAAGTRTAEAGDSGLGAPRINYGSTNSKVGAAAFKTGPAAFRQPDSDGQTASNFQATNNFQAGAQNERARASIDRNAGILRFENEVGPENYHFAFETDNGIQAEENGVATNGVQAQGGFSYTGDDGQVYSVSYTADEGGYQPKGDHLPTPPPIPLEILKSLEQNARDEAAGLVDDGSYSAEKYNAGSDYTESDNANGKFTHQSSKFGSSEADATPSGTFINQANQPFRKPGVGQSGFNGQAEQGPNFDEQGHLIGPVDEAFGFKPSQSGANSDANAQNGAQSGQASNGFSGHFGQSANSASASSNRGGSKGQSTFGISQSGSSGQNSQSANIESTSSNQGGSNGQTSFGSSQGHNNRFGSSTSAQASSSSQTNAFGNRNEYLPPTQNGGPQNGRPQNRPQNGRPQGRPQSSPVNTASQVSEDKETSNDEERPANFVPLGQQDLQSESRPQEAITSFGKPISNGFSASSSQNTFGASGSSNKNGRRPSATYVNGFSQGQSSQSGNNGRPNEYLPPSNNQNRRPSNRPQESNNAGSQFNQQYNTNSQSSGDITSPQDRPQGSFSSPSSGSQSSFGTQSQQSTSFQRPQSSRPGSNGNRFPSSQSQTQFGSVTAQSGSSFGSSSRPTSQPDLELTTPLVTDASDVSASQTGGQISASSFASSGVMPSNGRPTQSAFSNQYNNGQNRFTSRPQGSNPRPLGQTQSAAFPTQSSLGQFNQNAQFGSQSQPENNEQFSSSSTQRPSFAQQPQGADDSYYYNQPARPFGTPQDSRFPSAPSNQFVSMTQQSSFSQSGQFSNSLQDVPSTAFPSSQSQTTRQPRPPTLAPVASSSQAQGQFGGQFSSQSQGSTRYPRPPTLAPTGPTSSSQSQFQGATNGVTQASISPFPSQSPTQASQSQGQFGSRPSYQQSSQFSQTQTSQSAVSSFGQQPTQASFGQQSSTGPQRPQRPINQFQSQSQVSLQSDEESQKENAPEEQPVKNAQYSGEIYEYNKPAQTLPPPDSTPASSTGQALQTQGQFGAQPSRPQFGQTNDEEDQRPNSQFGSQAQGSRPQFGGQSRPQFGQAQAHNNFGARPSTQESKPYGALAQNTFAQTQQLGSRPQSNTQGRPQFGQAQNAFGVQKTEDKKTELSDEESQADSTGSTNQFGFVSSCCKESPQFGRKPQTQGIGGPTAGQSQFAQSFAGAQSFKPEPTSSFAGKGEEFGGPRQPPSFDEQTGYHY